MRPYTLFLALFLAFNVSTQTEYVLRIQHRLMNQTFQLNQVAQNDLNMAFKVDRLQYYVTRISLVHDGGQTYAISDDTMALINAATASYSDISLGFLSGITNVEGIQFHIGVFAPRNNADPSQYPANHPLAPQNPSMHWGWSSGYRFLVFEGKSGANFAQTFQLHGLWNENYRATALIPTNSSTNNNKEYIHVKADYEKGLSSIQLDNGPIDHGTNREDSVALLNFSNQVFSASSANLSLSKAGDLQNIILYPNPCNGKVNIQFNQNHFSHSQVLLMNAKGQLLREFDSLPSQIEGLEPGIYLLSIETEKQIITRRIVVQ